MPRLSHSRALQQIGLDNTQWKEAGRFCIALRALNDGPISELDFKYVNRSLLFALFSVFGGVVHHKGRHCAWYLDVEKANPPKAAPRYCTAVYLIYIDKLEWGIHTIRKDGNNRLDRFHIQKPRDRQRLFDMIYPPSTQDRRSSHSRQSLLQMALRPKPPTAEQTTEMASDQDQIRTGHDVDVK